MEPLDVLCCSSSFWIAQNPAAPLDLSRLTGAKRQTLEWLLQQRFDLSPALQERIKLQLRHRSSYGMLVQFVVGLLCPCPGVAQTAAWDYGAWQGERCAAAVAGELHLLANCCSSQHKLPSSPIQCLSVADVLLPLSKPTASIPPRRPRHGCAAPGGGGFAGAASAARLLGVARAH
jgi:hypothetical protein